MKILSRYKYIFVIILLALSTIVNIFSNDDTIRTTLSLLVFVLVILIFIASIRVTNIEKN